MKNKKLKIYLAGKIGNSESGIWREQILFDSFGRNSSQHADYKDNVMYYGNEWDILENRVLGKHDYTGPFFIDNHRLSEGNNTHGLIYGNHSGWRKEKLNSIILSNEQSKIISLCVNAIKNSDLVFAWITDKTCYGTLVEIGYAKALGIKTFVAGPEKLEDLWFSYQMANDFVFDCDNPKDALNYLIEKNF